MDVFIYFTSSWENRWINAGFLSDFDCVTAIYRDIQCEENLKGKAYQVGLRKALISIISGK